MRIGNSIPIRIGILGDKIRMKRPMSKLGKKFSKKIKELRGEQSQVKFAKTLKIAQSTLNRIENSEQSITLYLLEKIAEALKTDPRELL